MDIHKPKPVHGWRAFFAEIGTIVIGVLIALSAEQAVETWNWEQKAKQGEAQMAIELKTIANLAAERAAVGPCLERRLLQLKADLIAPQAGRRPQAMWTAEVLGTAVYLAPQRAWNHQVWNSLVADGTAAHLSRQRQIRYGALYGWIDFVTSHSNSAGETAELNILATNLDLPMQERMNLLALIERERSNNGTVSGVAGNILRRIAQLGPVDQREQDRFVANSHTLTACRAAHLA